MKPEMLIGLLYFVGLAFGAACVVVVTQLVFLQAAVRMRRWLLPLVPILAWGAGAASFALSKRSINYVSATENVLGDRSAVWINRSVTAILMAIAVAILVQILFENRRSSARPVETRDSRANHALFIALMCFVAGSLLLPMMLAQNPGFQHDGIPAVLVACAIYIARRESIDGFVTGAKWTLFLIMVGSLVAAVAVPALAVQHDYSAGWIPGLRFRLWGLAAHANALGALALYLLLLQLLRPSPRGWVNLMVWGVLLVTMLLSQSKTAWLSASLVGLVVLGYRWGRLPNGGMRMSFVVTLLFGMAALSLTLMFIDTSRLFAKFMATDTGTNFTTLTGRTVIWAAAFDMWKDSPFFGYGLDAWAPLHRIALGLPFATHAHNQLMQSLSVGGLVSALTLLVYVSLLTAAAFRAAGRTRGVSLGLMLYILIRCVTEAPLDFSNLTGADMVAHLVLLAILVNEHRRDVDEEIAQPLARAPRWSPMVAAMHRSA